MLEKLIEDHRKTRKQLGELSDAFGYVLEDMAMKSLPSNSNSVKCNFKLPRH